MLLSEAMSRTRAHIDAGADEDEDDRYEDAEVRQKLRVAVELVAERYAAEGGVGLDELVSVSSTDGYCNLGAYRPLQIGSVKTSGGGYLIDVPQILEADYINPITTGTLTLRIRLVRNREFPSSDASQLLYGNGICTEPLDELITLQAARLLITRNDAVSQALELQFDQIMKEVLRDEMVVPARDMSRRNPPKPSIGFIFVKHGLYLANLWY